MPGQKKNVRKTSRRINQVLHTSTSSSLFQIKPEPYRSETPNFLLSIVDSIMQADNSQALRLDFLHYNLEQLVQIEGETPDIIWIFIDPQGKNHQLTQEHHSHFTLLNSSHLQAEAFPPQSCQNILKSRVPQEVQEQLKSLQVVSLEQLRLKCEANMFTCPSVFMEELRKLIAWHQLFRCGSLKTFQYISQLFQKIVVILDKKDFFKKFSEIKAADLTKLMKEETPYKLDVKEWPFIPTNFRQYEEINSYVPSPPTRDFSIQRRIRSNKVPEECGPECVCVSEQAFGKPFCNFSLLNGWETKCPNRARKIQCQHEDPQLQKRCRNSEIQKKERKRCKNEKNEEGQIEERIAWGIDLYTRNVFYHCLPEFDIQGSKDKVANQERKNIFLERTLTKAFNLLGTQGYSIVEVCKFIKKKSIPIINKKISEEGQESKQENSEQCIFTRRDAEYADLLLRNYELADDKTAFRVHTKGKGAVCIDPKGLEQGTFLIEYFGQIYEPWRWYDREDFIKEIMKKKKIKNHMPEFYNIAMEKHQDEPLGCDMLMVDPSRKGNYSSRFSHSCDPNCGTVITVSDGKYFIGMYTFKDIVYGEELTFDYCSMTESNYQHFNSICLCGMKRCRGHYLQLSNTKMFTSLMDSKNCFFTRNSAILKSDREPNQGDKEMCAKYNIKQGLLQGCPSWLTVWIARVLTFIEDEGLIYQQSLMLNWKKDYPWTNAQNEEQKDENIKKYSLISRQELESIRLQNLMTSVDKIKYFYEHNTNRNPPIFEQRIEKIEDVLINKDDSVLKELQDNLIRYKLVDLPRIIEQFLAIIKNQEDHSLKLSLFRLCCLIVSHRLMLMKEASFNHRLLADIVFFYSLTHTYFSASQFQSFDAQEISVTVSQILGQKASSNERRQRSLKKYASPFVWGQMASWFKQTIVCPEASLSQDRRGTLSYPLIRSIMRSEYPYEKQSRSYFLSILREKPTGSWPPAKGCDLSFKNPYKLYGTMLFESVHSKDKLMGQLPKETLLESCMSVISGPLLKKVELFKKVELILGNLPEDHKIYELLVHAGDLNVEPPSFKEDEEVQKSPRKKLKLDSDSV